VPVIGLHCSHEQIPPSRLLKHVKEAEAAGFRAARSSDHFSPWSERQGESGFAWSFLSWDLVTVEQIDQAAAHVRPEDLRDSVLVSDDTERHAAWLHELAGLGFDELHLHHVGQDLGPFIQAFGERVLPEVQT
jgi:alkanesulfonate monooxygenase SsuD/methylene tetrahydromethanopterin reductase-like flavin-dependent oxidoreductase (luciferase family)